VHNVQHLQHLLTQRCKNFIGGVGVGVDKPSPQTSLEEQTLTFEGLEERKFQYLKFSGGLNSGIVTHQNQTKVP